MNSIFNTSLVARSRRCDIATPTILEMVICRLCVLISFWKEINVRCSTLSCHRCRFKTYRLYWYADMNVATPVETHNSVASSVFCEQMTQIMVFRKLMRWELCGSAYYSTTILCICVSRKLHNCSFKKCFVLDGSPSVTAVSRTCTKLEEMSFWNE